MIQPNNDPFTPSEVRSLIEEFRGDLRLFGEHLLAVREDVSILKDEVKDIKFRLTTVEDIIRINIPAINARLSALEARK